MHVGRIDLFCSSPNYMLFPEHIFQSVYGIRFHFFFFDFWFYGVEAQKRL